VAGVLVTAVVLPLSLIVAVVATVVVVVGFLLLVGLFGGMPFQ